MALGTPARTASKSSNSAKPCYFDYLTFVGDSTYTTPGTIGFDAFVKACVGILDGREVIGIIPQSCSGYSLAYTAANGGTLRMYEEGADGGPADEVANGDYSAITFVVLVISQ